MAVLLTKECLQLNERLLMLDDISSRFGKDFARLPFPTFYFHSKRGLSKTLV